MQLNPIYNMLYTSPKRIMLYDIPKITRTYKIPKNFPCQKLHSE